MKINDLTFEEIYATLKVQKFYMHTDASDEMRVIGTADQFGRARKELTKRYGNVEVELKAKTRYGETKGYIVILDAKWRQDHSDCPNLCKVIADALPTWDSVESELEAEEVESEYERNGYVNEEAYWRERINL